VASRSLHPVDKERITLQDLRPWVKAGLEKEPELMVILNADVRCTTAPS
jgi:hypothetical protein